MDLIEGDDRQALLNEASRRADVLPISAISGEGIDALKAFIAERLRSGSAMHSIRIPLSDGGRIAWLHARGEVVGQRMHDGEVEIEVRLSPENWARYQSLEDQSV